MLPVGNSHFNMTVNVAHLVSWLSVHMIHLRWVYGGLGRALWPFHGCRSFCNLCAYPTRAGPLPKKMFDTMPRTAVLPPLACSQDTKIQGYYATPAVTQKKLYMNLLLGVDAYVLMDGALTGPYGCQFQIMPESCLG